MDYRVVSVRLGLWACLGRQAWTASEAFQVLRGASGRRGRSDRTDRRDPRDLQVSPD